MEVGEALAYNRQIWDDIAQMPPGAGDRYLAMAERTEEFQDAQAAEAAIQAMANILGNLSLQKIEATMPLKAPVAPKRRLADRRSGGYASLAEEYHARYPDRACMPLVTPIAQERLNDLAGADKRIFTLYQNYTRLKSEVRAKVGKLGPAKARKIENRYEGEFDRLFATATQLEDGSSEHFAQNPYIFGHHVLILEGMMSSEVLRYEGMTAANVAAFQTEIVKRGIKYTTSQSEKLIQDPVYMRKLVSELSYEIQFRDTQDVPATSLLAALIDSAVSPERAVDLAENLFEAYLESYCHPGTLVNTAWIFQPQLDYERIYRTFNLNIGIACTGAYGEDLARRALGYATIASLPAEVNLNLVPVGFGTENQRKLLEEYGLMNYHAWRYKRLKEQLGSTGAAEEAIRKSTEDNATVSNWTKTLNKTEFSRVNDFLTETLHKPDLPLFFDVALRNPTPLIRRYAEVLGGTRSASNIQIVALSNNQVLDIRFSKSVTPDERRTILQNTYQMYREQEAILQATSEQHKWRRGLSIQGVGEATFEPQEGVEVTLRYRSLLDDELMSPLDDFEIKGFHADKELPSREETITHIKQMQARFVPRRGIEAVVTDRQAKHSGLSKLVYKYLGPEHLKIEAVIHGRTRQFQLKDWLFYRADGSSDPIATENSEKFARYCLQVLAEWMCRPAVLTEEGEVSEGVNGPVKGGYYSYLRVSDGKKWKRQDEQWYACVDEQGIDLDERSLQRQLKDPTGQGRNSTYVRLSEDDGEHLRPLRVYL